MAEKIVPTKPVTAPRHLTGPRKPFDLKNLSELLVELNRAASKLYVTMSALDHGDFASDLELTAAGTLKQVYFEVSGVAEDLVAFGASYELLGEDHPDFPVHMKNGVTNG